MKLLVIGAALVGGYYIYQRGQKRLAACCPPGITQGTCLMAVGPGFVNTMKLGLQGGPVASPVCALQQTVAKHL